MSIAVNVRHIYLHTHSHRNRYISYIWVHAVSNVDVNVRHIYLHLTQRVPICNIHIYICGCALYAGVLEATTPTIQHTTGLYGLATVSRIDSIIGLFCRISSLL